MPSRPNCKSRWNMDLDEVPYLQHSTSSSIDVADLSGYHIHPEAGRYPTRHLGLMQPLLGFASARLTGKSIYQTHGSKPGIAFPSLDDLSFNERPSHLPRTFRILLGPRSHVRSAPQSCYLFFLRSPYRRSWRFFCSDFIDCWTCLDSDNGLKGNGSSIEFGIRSTPVC
ncbi:hypothetical protein BJX99DRAFT_184189 [Aspergillus californicus]